MKNKTCGECKYHDSEHNICTNVKDYKMYACKNSGACHDFTKSTLFHRITEFPEVLAPYFVRADFDEPFLPWFSTLTNESYRTKEEAIAATVARLKEVCDE